MYAGGSRAENRSDPAIMRDLRGRGMRASLDRTGIIAALYSKFTARGKRRERGAREPAAYSRDLVRLRST